MFLFLYFNYLDCGANLTNKKFIRDLDQVIQRAQNSGNQTWLFYKTRQNKNYLCIDLANFLFNVPKNRLL
jgi:Tat protein secretion system quality control protein TatD with DNase activity